MASQFQKTYDSFDKVVESNISNQDPQLMIEPTRLHYKDQGAIEFRDPDRPWLLFFGFGKKNEVEPTTR